MYKIRLPWRIMTFVNKEKMFETVEIIDSRTKAELKKEYIHLGQMLTFERGFTTVDVDKSEISSEVLDRALHNLRAREGE